MNNFAKWYDEADMPTKDKDGKWYDAETGFAYTQSKPKTKAALSTKALEAREIAKFFGGYALTGSKKQKEWAEKIRAEKLQGLSDEHLEEAYLLCEKESLSKSAHFWIANREKTPAEFAAFITKQKNLLKAFKQAKEADNQEQAKQIANQYNFLTAAWGFTQ